MTAMEMLAATHEVEVHELRLMAVGPQERDARRLVTEAALHADAAGCMLTEAVDAYWRWIVVHGWSGPEALDLNQTKP